MMRDASTRPASAGRWMRSGTGRAGSSTWTWREARRERRGGRCSGSPPVGGAGSWACPRGSRSSCVAACWSTCAPPSGARSINASGSGISPWSGTSRRPSATRRRTPFPRSVIDTRCRGSGGGRDADGDAPWAGWIWRGRSSEEVLAGEATDPERIGTVEGALASGERAARAVLKGARLTRVAGTFVRPVLTSDGAPVWNAAGSLTAGGLRDRFLPRTLGGRGGDPAVDRRSDSVSNVTLVVSRTSGTEDPPAPTGPLSNFPRGSIMSPLCFHLALPPLRGASARGVVGRTTTGDLIR